MILADTSVWIDHLRGADTLLADLLRRGRVLAHPFVIGELACGGLRDRDRVLTLLAALPSAERAADEEVLAFVERSGLWGKGLGLMDVHLLASTAATPAARLLTRDRRLAAQAQRLSLAYDG